MENARPYGTLTAAELAAGLMKGAVMLVDVREPAEFAAERIHGAFLYPLSTFDPKLIPTNSSRPVVLQCGSGKRSADALERCRRAGVEVLGHLGGGIAAWKAAGQAVVVLDPATGRTLDRNR